MSKKKPVLAKHLLAEVLKNPKVVIAASDYFGYEDALYHPDFILYRKNEVYREEMPTGGNFLNNKGCFKKDTIYFGHSDGLSTREEAFKIDELLLVLKANPEAVIATSDYFGSDHTMYYPEIIQRSAGDFYDLHPENGSIFLDKTGVFLKDTLYLGHPN